jgi:hypothetical protein
LTVGVVRPFLDDTTFDTKTSNFSQRTIKGEIKFPSRTYNIEVKQSHNTPMEAQGEEGA